MQQGSNYTTNTGTSNNHQGQCGPPPYWGPTLQLPAQPPAWLMQIFTTAITAYVLRPPAPAAAAAA